VSYPFQFAPATLSITLGRDRAFRLYQVVRRVNEKMDQPIENDETAHATDANISIAQALLKATEILDNAGVPEARREASSLLSHVIGRDRTFVISHAEDLIEASALKVFESLIQRRSQGEPHQYITGLQHFFGLELKVTPDVLIPRPETELLVEAALNLIGNKPSPLICDIGTGSGCIAVALLHEKPGARAVAIDLSEPAIHVARANAIRYEISDRVCFLVSDCFSALNPFAARFDLIVSNPPYVSASALPGLQREVRDHEPQVALTPGGDGLSMIRRLLHDSPSYLNPGGYLVFEIGFDQGQTVREMVSGTVWRFLDIHADLQGIPRIVALQKLPA
jgi:release factor glutamine methyltransferase